MRLGWWTAFATLLLGLALGMSMASAQVIDPRAIAECEAKGEKHISQLRICLPWASAGLVAIDAFKFIYGPDGDFLVENCTAQNEGTSEDIAQCLMGAVNGARELKTMLPAGSKIDDRVFNFLADKDMKGEAFREAYDASKEKYDVYGANRAAPYDANWNR